MHRALAVGDIVHNILQHVKSSGTDLINVAVTCSTLSDPALNILWLEQSSLGPLVMCLPQDTWEVTENRTIKLSRVPQLTEWERVRTNASRIRRIISERRNHVYVPPRPSAPVLRQLFALFPPAILFPKLCAMHFDAVSHLPEIHSDFLLLRQFFLPRLETLAFNVPSRVPTYEVEQLISALPAEASGLRQLSIMSSQDMPLELSALKRLFLRSPRLQNCTSFLLQIATPQLSTIEIGTHRTAATPEEITALIESLSTSCQTFGYLEKISVVDYSPGQWWEHESQSELYSRIFRPLLQFRRLSTVEFVDTGKFRLNDSFIEDAAVAWPYLRVLKFASEKVSDCDVTFTAMLSLASKCKLLHCLHLTFDATYFPILPHAQDGNRELWTTQTALSELHVGRSKVSPASQFHLFLAVVFPNLVDLSRSYTAYRLADGIAWRQLKEAVGTTGDLSGDVPRNGNLLAKLPTAATALVGRGDQAGDEELEGEDNDEFL
ncbi:uncharacterized protein BJ212DRAFT_1591281 [Suillus subaureus]|uniref:F-box domain-containing protein n=1 Tax=Suillus subaureus TaxID=48587 RepID=A0A9P7DT97_9AGAM|nr:uncharacterized protein BJ212DRAFT_1591281 [Suillus subaureus]KAG1802522.1 hypothetical protein BJ212DRAFT_1591281 [Suillus subaureus]